MSRETAFPVTASSEYEYVGMSLRDYMAIHALPIVPVIAKEMYSNIETWDVEAYAVEAYKIADAMLAAREKGKGEV